MFHTVRLRDKNYYKLSDFYKICLQVLAYNIMHYNTFWCGAIGIPGFDPQNAAKMDQAIVRLWLESNHSSIDCVTFCGNQNKDYEIYKDVMSAVYFPVSKYHLNNIRKKNQIQILL